MNSRHFLETYKNKIRADISNVLQYYKQFSAILQNLIAKGKLNLVIQSYLFLQELLSVIPMELFYYYKLNPDNDLNINFANLLKKTLGFLRTKKKLVDLVQIANKSDQIEDLVNKCEKKTQISFVTNYFTLLPKSAFQPLVATLITKIYFGAVDLQPVDRKIDQLIEMIQGLALSIRTL